MTKRQDQTLAAIQLAHRACAGIRSTISEGCTGTIQTCSTPRKVLFSIAAISDHCTGVWPQRT